MLSDLKDVYNLRKYIFSIRFFPFSISLVITILIYYTYGLFNKYFFYSILLILFTYLFSKIWVRFNSKIKFAKNLHKEFKFSEEYQLYNRLQTETLLDSEKFVLQLQQAHLFFIVGNFKRFIELIDELSIKKENYPKKENFFRLLKSFYYEIKNDFIKSKSQLELIVENTKETSLKIQAYNNIARLEEIENNILQAQVFYEKAFYLLKEKPIPRFFPITIHNLIICYSKNNHREKAIKILDDYYNLIDKNNAQQLLEYTNDLTHFARQINDKELLDKSYLISNKKLSKLLKFEENFIFEITQLRMRYNDDIDFEKYFIDIYNKIKLNKDNFILIEKINILSELKHVIKQKAEENFNTHEKWLKYFMWFINWELSLENDVRNKLKDVESPLSTEKVFWLSQLINIQKAILLRNGNIHQFFDLNELNNITKSIEEIIKIWENVENEVAQINEIIHFIDEIYSFYEQTKIIKIVENYNKKINLYLVISDNLLEKHYTNPHHGNLLIAVAYFSLVIKNDKLLAKKWIERFKASNISLNHYAKYLRSWYYFCENNLKE